MKVKLALLLLAAIGSTALVASAQTPSAYTITPRTGAGSADLAPLPPQPPQPAPFVTAPVPPGGMVRFSNFNARPQILAYTVEEGGLTHQAEQLAQQLAAAKSDSDRDKIKGQLTEVLEKQFDQRQKRHEEEIKQLEEQIKKLKELVDKRHENRREIIGARLNQILKESQGLGW
jgi:flagellar motility protein MotE (MotC chaperone)